MKNILLSCASALILCGPTSWAAEVPAYESTGTIELSIDGKQSTHHSTSNTIPGQPGKMVHAANWRISKPVMLGGVNLAPPGILVSIRARPTIQPDPSAPELVITFYVDENDYRQVDNAPFQVIYTIKEGPMAGRYQHATGSLNILSATMEGEALKVSGQVAGTLASAGKKKEAKRTLNYEASFVVNTQHP